MDVNTTLLSLPLEDKDFVQDLNINYNTDDGSVARNIGLVLLKYSAKEGHSKTLIDSSAVELLHSLFGFDIDSTKNAIDMGLGDIQRLTGDDSLAFRGENWLKYYYDSPMAFLNQSLFLKIESLYLAIRSILNNEVSHA